jgi:hypothetical protein
LSELLVAAAGEPLQVEVPAVRLLSELLGFLLRSIAAALQFRSTIQQLRTDPRSMP